MLTAAELRERVTGGLGSQWQDSPVLVSLLNALTNLAITEVLDPMDALGAWPDTRSQYQVLDNVGGLLGLPRPTLATGTWFGT